VTAETVVVKVLTSVWVMCRQCGILVRTGVWCGK